MWEGMRLYVGRFVGCGLSKKHDFCNLVFGLKLRFLETKFSKS